MKQMQKMGPMEGLLKMIPGVNTKMLKQAKQADPKRIKHLEAIVLSMTKEERTNPGLINGTRRARVETLARSDPAVGSLMPRQNTASPRMIAGITSRRRSSLP